uniref:C2 domain-containing protein n=1 Tax=Rhizophagus irregularis (strain DAOM 181602 / DAOM 197198 / MUCL 43194) TaxID=747089 RepID=U9TJE5_RHIID
MVLWFLRFLLKEHRSEWAGIYERSEKYITKELGGDLEVEEIAIAGGRKAVRERFEIKDDLIVHSKTIVIARRTVSVRLVRLLLSYQKESGCFELDNHLAETLDFSSVRPKKQRKVWKLISHLIQKFQNLIYVLADFRIDKYQITSKWITEQEIEDEIKSENGAIVTQVIIGLLKIKIKNARNLPKSSLLFTYSKPDPYVRILDASGQEIVRTRTISETTEPKWEEVHYVSIHGTGENITFEIMDKNLSVADKPSCEPIRELFSLVIGRKPSGGELDLEVQFVSAQYNWKESFVFKKKTLTIEHIYIILSWRNTRSYFEFSDDIAHFFNYKSQEELKTWKNISADSEEWLGSEIDNIDKLYEICENFIIKRFNIKDLDEEQKNILISVKKRVIITRKLVTIRVIRRIHVYQTQDGAIPLDKTAELLGFENTEDLKKELQTYFKSGKLDKETFEEDNKFDFDIQNKNKSMSHEEVERNSKYITQTYNFSLNDLKEAFDNNANFKFIFKDS